MPSIKYNNVRWVLGILLGINLLNYLDRQVLFVLLPLIKAEMHASDAQLGALASAFMLVYMCAAPPIGYWADRSSRKNWIAFGVGFWSFATLLSGMAVSYRQLFASRAAVGIGESCYGSVSPSFIAEYYPKDKRAKVLAIFSMAIPVGSALGYILGGAIGQHWGWRRAFYLAGIPGFLFSVMAYFLRDPGTERKSESANTPPSIRDYSKLFYNPSFVSCTLAMAAMTFGLGAYAVWMPTFFTRTWGMSISQAGTLFGALTVVSGLSGSLIGGWLADYTLKTNSKAYFLISGIGLILAFPFGCAAVLLNHLSASITAVFFAEFCAFLNMGPLNALIVSVTRTQVRSMAFAANIFIIHALGDMLSPAIVGMISDAGGLKIGLLVAATALGVAGGICFWGMRFVDEDTRQANIPTLGSEANQYA